MDANVKIDPQLSFLLEATKSPDFPVVELAEAGEFGLETGGTRGKPVTAEVEVLVQATCERDVLEKAGLKIRSELGNVFTGTIRIDKVENLSKIEKVNLVEGARTLTPELDLAVLDTRADLVHTGPPGRTGAGVIVGVVDTGIDYTHPAFRNPDGTSRILCIWDQVLNPTGSEASPAPFGYGVEYTQAEIDAALENADPFESVRHEVGTFNHGTHVAGIAAGNGRGSSDSQPEFSFVGVAPEADLIVVRVGGGGAEGLGTSANALDAVNYCYRKADEFARACVVNMSLGDNLGPHDGTSLLERGLDNLLGAPGRAFVKSAGNAGNARQHAGGTIAHGTTVDVGFTIQSQRFREVLDFWYPGGSTFRARVQDSAGNATALVNPGNATTFTLEGGNTVRIDHRNNDPFNGDNRIYITIGRGTADEIRPGNWTLRLVSVSSEGGERFDGWIQRPPRAFFRPPHESSDRTITTPGTAHKVITAGNYAVRAPGAGTLRASSSRGPTRDERAAPTLAAPGTRIYSAASAFGAGNPYRSDTGTSMAAPHVAGVIALMFQKNRHRTQAQIRDCLTDTARSDDFTGPTPNTAWGAGKVDAKAAVDCVPLRILPPRTTFEPACQRFTVVGPQCKLTVVNPQCQLTVVGPQCQLTVVGPQCQMTVVGQHCPSAVDACPSAPTGCDPRTPPINPGWPVLPPGGLRSAGPGTKIDQDALLAAQTAYWKTLQAMMEAQIAAAETPASERGLPSKGYYEYDEGWFDPDDSDSQG